MKFAKLMIIPIFLMIMTSSNVSALGQFSTPTKMPYIPQMIDFGFSNSTKIPNPDSSYKQEIVNYVLDNFSKNHLVDTNSVNVVKDENLTMYNMTIYHAEVQVDSQGKTIPFFLDADSSRIWSYQIPTFNELTGIKKISYGLWQVTKTKNPDDKIELILSFSAPSNLNLSDRFPDDEINGIAANATQLKEQLQEDIIQNLTKPSKSIQYDMVTIKNKLEQIRKTEVLMDTAREVSDQSKLQNQENIVNQTLQILLPKLGSMDGLKVTSTPSLSPSVDITCTIKDVDKLLAIPEVNFLDLNEKSRVTLDHSVSTIFATNVQSRGDNGSNVKVAVLDTGISGNTNDVVSAANSAVPGENTTDFLGHGTSVAGVIASRHGTYKGVAPYVYLMNAKSVNALGLGYLSWESGAIDWARINGATIFNHSSAACYSQDDNGTNEWSEYHDYAIDAYDIFIAQSQGNYDLDCTLVPAPAGSYNVITVGATDDKNTNDRSDDHVAIWRNSGFVFHPSPGPTGDGRKKPDLSAPGTLIYTTNHNNSFENVNGTSFAAPHVAGTAALVKYDRPGISSLETKAVIINAAAYTNITATNKNNATWDKYWGWGYTDADKAVTWDYNTFTDIIGTYQTKKFKVSANQNDPIIVTLTWNRHMSSPTAVLGFSDLDVSLYDPNGNRISYSNSNINNVEIVYAKASVGGTYTIDVLGASVPSPLPYERFAIASNKSISLYDSCIPTPGGWSITSDCFLISDTTINGHVTISNNAILVINPGVTLTVPFSTKHMNVTYGSFVFIQNTGKIT